MIRQYTRGIPERVSKNFISSEFDCRCSHKECVFTYIDEDLISRLQAMRDEVGKEIHIDSGYRCKAHQKDLKAQGLETSIGQSTHEVGMAADVWVSGYSGSALSAVAKAACFRRMGIALAWIHVDTKDGQAEWFYRSAKNARDFKKGP